MKHDKVFDRDGLPITLSALVEHVKSGKRGYVAAITANEAQGLKPRVLVRLGGAPVFMRSTRTWRVIATDGPKRSTKRKATCSEAGEELETENPT